MWHTDHNHVICETQNLTYSMFKTCNKSRMRSASEDDQSYKKICEEPLSSCKHISEIGHIRHRILWKAIFHSEANFQRGSREAWLEVLPPATYPEQSNTHSVLFFRLGDRKESVWVGQVANNKPQYLACDVISGV